MHRTYTSGLRVTKRQDAILTALLLHLCELYNAALQERKEAWARNRKSVFYHEQQKELTELRSECPEYSSFPAFLQRDPLKRLDRAFQGFFRRVKAHEEPGYPRFRSCERYDSFSVDSQNFRIENGTLIITKLGGLRFKTQAKMKGKPKVIQVKRFGGKWRAFIVCDIGTAPEKHSVQKAVGIDVGLTRLAVLSDGTEIKNPRWTKQFEEKLAQANRKLSRKHRGSRNRFKCKEHLRRLYQRIVGKRKAYLHAVSGELVRRYDLIVYENLNVSEMGKGDFAKSIMDAAWGELIWQISYKAEWAGRYAIAVDPRGTSQVCSGCGAIVQKTLWNKTHNCPKCGLSLSRDLNASRNILERGRRSAGLFMAGGLN